MEKRYGQWTGNEKGYAQKPDRCFESVTSQGEWISHQCNFKKKFGDYCAKHRKEENADVEKINDNIKLLEKQKEVEELKYQISTSIRRLEDIVGREPTKDYLSQFPLAF